MAYSLVELGEQDLLLSYNIGIDRDVRQRQIIKSTAALVGFKLPKLEETDNSDDEAHVREGPVA